MLDHAEPKAPCCCGHTEIHHWSSGQCKYSKCDCKDFKLAPGHHKISAASERGQAIHDQIMREAARVVEDYMFTTKPRRRFMRIPRWLRKRTPETIKVTIPMQWAPKGPRIGMYFKHPAFNLVRSTDIFREKETHKLVLDVEQENALIRIEVADPLELAKELCDGVMWREEQKAEKSATMKEADKVMPKGM